MPADHHSTKRLPVGFTASLASGQVACLGEAAEERLLLILRGRLWLTWSGDASDYWLQAGDCLALPAGRSAVIEAWPQADFQLLQPVAHLTRPAHEPIRLGTFLVAKAGMAAGTRPMASRVLGWLLQRFPVTP